MAVTSRTVRVALDPSMIQVLKDNEYNLCFAKKVGCEDYNTVWQCYAPHDYLMNNTFSWVPLYQMFGINDYPEPNATNATTNIQNIAPGQICTLDQYGTLQPASDGGSIDSLSLKNEYGVIRVGLNQCSIGIRGVREFSPIYVTPNFMIKGEASFKPVECLLVWFEQNARTGDRFKNARSNVCEVDLTEKSECAIFYNSVGDWENKG